MPAQLFPCPGFWPAALYKERGIYEAPHGNKSFVKRPAAPSGAKPPETQPVSLVSCPKFPDQNLCLCGWAWASLDHLLPQSSGSLVQYFHWLGKWSLTNQASDSSCDPERVSWLFLTLLVDETNSHWLHVPKSQNVDSGPPEWGKLRERLFWWEAI